MPSGAAVDVDGLAGDQLGAGPAEHGDRGADLGRSGQAPQRGPPALVPVADQLLRLVG